MKLPIAQAGGEALTAIVWVSWIVALLVTEAALQWGDGRPRVSG